MMSYAKRHNSVVLNLKYVLNALRGQLIPPELTSQWQSIAMGPCFPNHGMGHQEPDCNPLLIPVYMPQETYEHAPVPGTPQETWF